MTEENTKKEIQIGDKIDDGTIYVGVSPDTGRKMYVAPADAPMRVDFNEAANYAKNLQVADKKDFRVPSKDELKMLCANCEEGVLKGTFNLSSSARGTYWSSTSYVKGYNLFAWSQEFSKGKQEDVYKRCFLSVRCVRG